MKTIRLIMMFFIICMLGACTAEELAGPESGVEDDAPVVIAISPKYYLLQIINKK